MYSIQGCKGYNNILFLVWGDMLEAQTWRTLLGLIIEDSRERQRLADTLRIHAITLVRWSNDKSNPRQENLRLLLHALPRHRIRLTELMLQEFPTLLDSNTPDGKQPFTIPSDFYSQVLDTYTSNPPQLRSTTVCSLILRQMFNQLDPQKQGLALLIAQCMPPVENNKIRSLRRTHWRVTGPWSHYHNTPLCLFGAESQAGHAVVTGHPVIIQNRQEKERLFPIHQIANEESMVAYPILLSDRTAGSLSIFSMQSDYFTQQLLNLIQSYVNLLTLAFEPQEFYSLHEIQLGLMPEHTTQSSLITGFQARIKQLLIEATRAQRQLTRPQAELLAWHELEEKLLQTVYAMTE